MNQLIINLDSLTPTSAARFARMLLACVGEAELTPLPVLDRAKVEHLENRPAVSLTADQVAAVDETAGIPDSGHIAPGYGPVTAKQYEEFVTTGAIAGLAVKFPEQLLPPAADAAQPVGRIDPARVSPPSAPSTAGAAPSSTAPEAQQAGAPAAPNVPQPPAPPVPAPPVPPASAPAANPALDAKGLPWDERIHSSSKALNADGTWRARRNMTDEQKAAVAGIEAELRQRASGAAVSVVAAGAGATAIIIDPSAGQPVSAIPLPPPAPPVPAPTATAPAGTTAASASPAPANAVELVQWITAQGDLLGADEVQRECAALGLPDTAQALMHLFAAEVADPTLVGKLHAALVDVMAS